MAESIFETMKTIEEEATQIANEYEEAIRQSEEKSEKILHQLVDEFQSDCRKEYEILERNLHRQKEELKSTVTEHIATNHKIIQDISEYRRKEFVQQIVSRVVEYYGD